MLHLELALWGKAPSSYIRAREVLISSFAPLREVISAWNLGRQLVSYLSSGSGVLAYPGAGASCLTSYLDPTTNESVLLVGGDNITQYTFHQYVDAGGSGTPIATGGDSLGLKDIHVAQSGDSLTIWYTTVADGAQYYSTQISDINNGLLVPLLADGTGGQISGVLSASAGNAKVLVNTLLSVNGQGDLTLLQQASDTGMWETHPFYTPSDTNNMKVRSFTLRIRALTDTMTLEQSVSNCQLHLVSSGLVHVLCNGMATTLTQDGGWYQADDTGVLTIIISTADISCHTVQADMFRPTQGPDIALTTTVLNPMQKVNSNLAAMNLTGNSLLGATTQTGKPLIDSGSITPDEANHAAGVISQLSSTQVQMQRGIVAMPFVDRGQIFSAETRNIKLIYLFGKLPADPDLLVKITTLGSSSSPWDFFHYLFQVAEDVESWTVGTVRT